MGNGKKKDARRSNNPFDCFWTTFHGTVRLPVQRCREDLGLTLGPGAGRRGPGNAAKMTATALPLNQATGMEGKMNRELSFEQSAQLRQVVC